VVVWIRGREWYVVAGLSPAKTGLSPVTTQINTTQHIIGLGSSQQ
jgi:hypothetical protein